MTTWAWILIAIGIVIAIALVVMMAMQQRRTTMLRRRFGPEYERTMQEQDGRRAAEADLRDRQKQRDRLDIRPLAEPARARFVTEWREVQERFVDQPSNAVVAADGLVYRVMAARGYPMDDFEAQTKVVSVNHPAVVENYRAAHDVCQRAQSQQANTEDLRAALLHYRSLFDELLQPEDAGEPGGADAPDTADDRTRRGAR
jgi:transposase InsO family protein